MPLPAWDSAADGKRFLGVANQEDSRATPCDAELAGRLEEIFPPGAVRSGSPVMENRLWLKVIAALKRLPEMQKTVRELAGEMARIKAAGK